MPSPHTGGRLGAATCRDGAAEAAEVATAAIAIGSRSAGCSMLAVRMTIVTLQQIKTAHAPRCQRRGSLPSARRRGSLIAFVFRLFIIVFRVALPRAAPTLSAILYMYFVFRLVGFAFVFQALQVPRLAVVTSNAK